MNIHYTTVKGRRDANEDKHTILLNLDKKIDGCNDINLLGIYDGHGGSKVSEYLEKNIPLIYSNNQYPFSKDYHYKKFEELQKDILKRKYGFTMGSTCLLNIIYKYNNEYNMNIINLGDSRLVIVYSNNKFKQITEDHKPDLQIEKERIEKLGGKIYNDSDGVCRIGDLSLSRSFGDGDNAPYISQVPDVYYCKIHELTKYIVMGCDGLWDVIENKELFFLLEEFKKNKNIENLATLLATEALNRGSTDNISVIIIEIIIKI